MSSAIHVDVAALDPAHRRALEDMLGHGLTAGQRLVIEVRPAATAAVEQPASLADRICGFYEGVPPDEVDAIDEALRVRANLSRPVG